MASMKVFVVLDLFAWLAVQTNGQACMSCPDGWMTFRKSCYLFLDNLEYTWDEASHFCGLEGAELVHIESAEENTFIKDHCHRLYKTASERHAHGVFFYLGGTDHAVDGIWQWSRGHGKFNFTDWGGNDPNEGILANCACLWGDFDFQWADIACKIRGHFICEKRKMEESSGQVIG